MSDEVYDYSQELLGKIERYVWDNWELFDSLNSNKKNPVYMINAEKLLKFIEQSL